MSDDEADSQLLELLRLKMGISRKQTAEPHDNETRILKDAQFVTNNAIDVVVDPFKTKEAAEMIYRMMQQKKYSTETWTEHPLHPKTKDGTTVDFIFTMDLLNFSFWSDEEDKKKQFAIEYRGQRWNGYSSLVGSLQRALDEGIPITTPSFWIDEEECSEDVLRHVFRSATAEQIPMFNERVQCLREAGKILCDKYQGSFTTCLKEAHGRAGYLVNLLADDFPCFRDRVQFKGKDIQIYKRAQILVADIWACFNGKGWGAFDDIDGITMFADYRIPQILQHLGCLRYAPSIEMRIRDKKEIPSGSRAEVEIRASTIWCVGAICREIQNRHRETVIGGGDYATMNAEADDVASPTEESHPTGAAEGNSDGSSTPTQSNPKSKGEEPETPSKQADAGEGTDNARPTSIGVNAILIDFLLYDTMKEMQAAGKESLPHHRTRSIWY
ncbi:hypothetical protein KEM54_006397 [Ascosphaera aggregata]|nr:hypothetical protein KEM54_006397 [Ascosphaera aggregata]